MSRQKKICKLISGAYEALADALVLQEGTDADIYFVRALDTCEALLIQQAGSPAIAAYRPEHHIARATLKLLAPADQPDCSRTGSDPAGSPAPFASSTYLKRYQKLEQHVNGLEDRLLTLATALGYTRTKKPRGKQAINGTNTVARESSSRQPKRGTALCPAFPDKKTLRVNPAKPGSTASLENLQALSGRLPASLLRSGSRILRRAQT